MLTSALSFLAVVASLAQALPLVLVYTATAGYRHDSIPTAIQVLNNTGSNYGINFFFSEDENLFTDSQLQKFDAIMFVSNSDEILTQDGKVAFSNYLNNGGNFVGVHAASACLFTTEFFQEEIGALFDYHPPIQQATFVPLDPTHPTVSMLPSQWTFQEEVYYFRSDPREVGAVVLLTVDESSYVDNGTSTGNYNMGSPHPIAWYQTRGAGDNSTSNITPGRSWYSSVGHLNETWQDATFQSHIFAGLTWTLQSNTTLAFNSSGLVGTAPNVTSPSSSISGSATTSQLSSASETGSRTLTGSVTTPATASASSHSGAVSVAVIGLTLTLGGLFSLGVAYL